jgi:hypothetical protein
MCQENVKPRDVSMPMHGKPYKYGIPGDHVLQGHLAEHVACILHVPTFCTFVNHVTPHKDI